jgi:hypothetical protein
MAETKPLSQMPTLGGMSVRKEIDARMDALWTATRSVTIEECITFLEQSGFIEAAEALSKAAFEPQEAAEKSA